jgi:hypothetical protein
MNYLAILVILFSLPLRYLLKLIEKFKMSALSTGGKGANTEGACSSTQPPKPAVDAGWFR